MTTITTSLPEWLVKDDPPNQTKPAFPRRNGDLSPEMRELEQQTFAIAFESLLEHVSDGRTFASFCLGYHMTLNPARFRAWIYRDKRRREAFYGAKIIGAEAVEDEMIRISDGLDADGGASMEDVARSALRINTRKYVLTVWNRERYGDVKKVESTVTTKVDPASLSSPELQRQLLEQFGLDPEAFEMPEPSDE